MIECAGRFLLVLELQRWNSILHDSNVGETWTGELLLECPISAVRGGGDVGERARSWLGSGCGAGVVARVNHSIAFHSLSKRSVLLTPWWMQNVYGI